MPADRFAGVLADAARVVDSDAEVWLEHAGAGAAAARVRETTGGDTGDQACLALNAEHPLVARLPETPPPVRATVLLLLAGAARAEARGALSAAERQTVERSLHALTNTQSVRDVADVLHALPEPRRVDAAAAETLLALSGQTPPPEPAVIEHDPLRVPKTTVLHPEPEPPAPDAVALSPRPRATVRATRTDSEQIDTLAALTAEVDEFKRQMPVSDGSLKPVIPTAELPVKPGDTQRYVFRREVARGGLGRIALVRDRLCHREIARKELIERPSADPRRFLEEAQITAQLEHPNIVPVYEIGQLADGAPYYTMPFIRGRPLTEFIHDSAERQAAGVYAHDRQQRALDRMKLVQTFVAACQAIAYAHAKGVIHRDLKPDNIMVGAYGEVLVVDWGLAKVLGCSTDTGELQAGAPVVSPRTGRERDTLEGTIAGTPAYMAPEQARGEIERLDQRSDVYALGAVLYEILTHEIPFSGDSQIEVLRRVMAGNPMPPRVRAPDNEIPAALEEICLTAMAREPAERFAHVDELIDKLTLFLEGYEERKRLHRYAEEKLAEAAALIERYWALREERDDAEQEVRRLRDATPDYETAAVKRPLWDTERRLETLRAEVSTTNSRAVTTLAEVFGFEPDHPEARRLAADFAYRQFINAEEAGDAPEALELYKTQTAFYDVEQRYAVALTGDGSLNIASDPPGAQVTLSRFVERERWLEPTEPIELGTTPARVAPIAMGSYVAVLTRPGFRTARVPILIGRQQQYETTVRLFPADYLPASFVPVPAGPFIWGGDEKATGSDPKTIREASDFFLGRVPVTCAEYLEFLEALRVLNPAEARRRSPRRAPDAGYLWAVDDAGRITLPPPEPDAEFAWQPDWPVMGVSYFDAMAYCAWLSATLGRFCTLPTDIQWEKAARGVDGRFFVWGNRGEGTFANCLSAHKDGPRMMPVASFPRDVSLYGIHDLTGNVGDWCRNPMPTTEGWRPLRGGYYTNTINACRIHHQRGYSPEGVFPFFGFRVAVLPDGPPDDSNDPVARRASQAYPPAPSTRS